MLTTSTTSRPDRPAPLLAGERRRITERQSGDGYAVGQRNAALLLDFLVLYDSGAPFADRVGHPGTQLSQDDLLAAHAVLVARGHAAYDGIGNLELTDAGLVAHASVDRALAALCAGVNAALGLPAPAPLGSLIGKAAA